MSTSSPVARVHLGQLRLRGAPALVAATGGTIDLETKDALLLAFVAVEGLVGRADLATRLWPDAAPDRARANLRQRLMRLRRVAGADLVVGADAVRLSDAVTHDLDATSDLLAPVTLAEAGGFAEWLDAARRARRAQRSEALAAAAARAESAGELAAALEHAQALVALDPVSEHAHRRLMRLHYLRGDVGAARAAYARCATILAREIGVPPAAETEALRRQIESGARVARPSRTPLPVTLLRPPTLIGREAPLLRLHSAWADRRAFLLVGEAGIGKSRLLEAFAQEEPGAVLVAARPGDRAVPLALIGRVVRALGSRAAAGDSHRRHAELLALLPGAPEPVDMAKPRRAGALFGAWLEAEGLAGLLIDDLQWADDASLEALREARALVSPEAVRWGLASRPGEDADGERRLAQVAADLAAERIDLTPLDVPTVETLLVSLQGAAGDEARHTAVRVHAAVGGNPHFVLEVLRQLHAAGGDWNAVQIPARLAELMDRRLAALSEGALMLARVAAIAGSDFSAELAEAMTGLGTLALASPWRELEGAHILAATAFTHDLAQAAVGRSIPQAIASRLHAKAAAFLESAGGDPARIASHHLEAGQGERAVPFLVTAARRAWHAGCAPDAAAFYFRAAEIRLAAGERDAAFDIYFDAAYAIHGTGRVEHLEQACRMLTRFAHTPAQHAKALLGEAALWDARGGDTDGFLMRTDAALLQAIAAGERAVEAECRHFKARICVINGRAQEAIEHIAAAELLFRAAGREDRVRVMQSSMAVMLGFVGHCERALELMRAIGPAESVSDGASSRAQEAMFALVLGRRGHARVAAESAARLLQTVDIADQDWPTLTVNTAAAFRRLGDYTSAATVIDNVTARLGNHAARAAALDAARASLYLELGRPDLATRAFASFEADPAVHPMLPYRLQLGRAAMRRTTPDAALTELGRIDPLTFPLLRTAFEWLFERARYPADDHAERVAHALLERGDGPKLVGLHAPAFAALARFGADRGAMEAALHHGRRAMALLEHCIPGLWPVMCEWLAAAFEAAGQPGEARACIRFACDWIERTAGEAVPAAFRDSFRERNPLHRRLLLAAARA